MQHLLEETYPLLLVNAQFLLRSIQQGKHAFWTQETVIVGAALDVDADTQRQDCNILYQPLNSRWSDGLNGYVLVNPDDGFFGIFFR